MTDPAPGAVVAGHRLLEKLGQGHFGEVWKAEFEKRIVAIKLFRAALDATRQRREGLAQQALSQLEGEDGRHFPKIEKIALDENPPYLRMEYVAGRTLEAVMTDASVTLARRRSIGLRIAEALSAVHRHGFVHGDLSPLNILVTGKDDVKLIDVGYGAIVEPTETDIRISATADEAGEVFGVASPLYAAPERFTSKFLGGCGKPADVFSFGKALYALMTGEQPFVVKPLSMRCPGLGRPWDEFLFRCLEERPGKRFLDAPEMLEALRRLDIESDSPEIEFLHEEEEILVIDGEGTVGTEQASAGDGRTRKFCPKCGRSILVEAKKCRWCRGWVDKSIVPPARKS